MDTLTDQLRRLADGEVSSVQLTERALARAEATRESLNAFRILCRDDALAAAAAADERRRAGDDGALLGVPVAIKDDTDLAGYPTGFGCAGDFPVAVRDAELVTRLRSAGAIVVGKTNTPELGQWPFTEGVAFGATRNAWDPDYTPGGSSGGSATAVAAGIVAAAIGSDGAGSVRIPAAWSHLVGIKPQRGRISTWPWPEAFYGITVHGPLARTVADAARLLDVVAGSTDGDLHRPPAPVDSFLAAAGRTPPRLRIAVSTRIPFSGFPAHLDPRIEAALRRIAQVLAGAGHHVSDADPRYGPAGLSFLPRSTVGLYDWLERMPDPAGLDPRTRDNIRTGRRLRPLLGPARRFEKPSAAPGRSDLRTLRRGAGPDDGPAAATDRRHRRDVERAHRPRDHRRLSVHLAVERPGLARGERAGRSGGRSARRRATDGTGRVGVDADQPGRRTGVERALARPDRPGRRGRRCVRPAGARSPWPQSSSCWPPAARARRARRRDRPVRRRPRARPGHRPRCHRRVPPLPDLDR